MVPEKSFAPRPRVRFDIETPHQTWVPRGSLILLQTRRIGAAPVSMSKHHDQKAVRSGARLRNPRVNILGRRAGALPAKAFRRRNRGRSHIGNHSALARTFEDTRDGLRPTGSQGPALRLALAPVSISKRAQNSRGMQPGCTPSCFDIETSHADPTGNSKTRRMLDSVGTAHREPRLARLPKSGVKLTRQAETAGGAVEEFST